MENPSSDSKSKLIIPVPVENPQNKRRRRPFFLWIILHTWTFPLVFKIFRTGEMKEEDIYPTRGGISYEECFPKFIKHYEKTGYKRPLRSLVLAFKWKLISVGLLSFMTSLTYSLPPLVLKKIIACLQDPNSSFSDMSLLVAASFGINFLNLYTGLHCNMINNEFSSCCRIILRRLMVEKMFRLHPSYSPISISAKINSISNQDIGLMVNVLVGLNSYVQNPLKLLFVWVLIVSEVGVWLGLAASGVFFFSIMIQGVFKTANRNNMKEKAFFTQDIIKLLTEFFSKMKSVKMNGWEPILEEKIMAFRKLTVDNIRVSTKIKLYLKLITQNTSSVVSVVVFCFTSLAGVELEPANAFAILALLGKLSGPIESLNTSIQSYYSFEVSYERFEWLMNAREREDYVERNPKGKIARPGYVRLRDASFSWIDEGVTKDEELFQQLKKKKVPSTASQILLKIKKTGIWIYSCFSKILRRKKQAPGNQSLLSGDSEAGISSIEITSRTLDSSVVSEESSSDEKMDGSSSFSLDSSMEMTRDASGFSDESLEKDKSPKRPSLIGKANALEKIDLKIQPGELIGVYGRVASGKSTLVSSLVADVKKIKGKVNVQGSVSFCPQETWLQQTTIRNNILFWREFNREKYIETLRLAQLIPDLESFKDKDLTEIGERGVTLSGGQKMRVAIARSIYEEADIYLFDDSFASLDAEVGTKIFEEVLLEKLKGKTRIVTFSNVRWLEKLDKVIILDDGQVAFYGDPEECKRSNAISGVYSPLKTQKEREPVTKEMTMERPQKKKGGMMKMKGKKKGKEERIETQQNGETLKEVSVGQQEVTSDSSLDVSITSNSSAGFEVLEDLPENRTKLIKNDKDTKGTVKLSTYIRYLSFSHWFSPFVYLFFFCFSSTFGIVSTWWVAAWTSKKFPLTTVTYSLFYAGFFAFSAIVNALHLVFHRWACLYSSSKIHKSIVDSLLSTKLQWFDQNPTGRVVARVTGNQSQLDMAVPSSIKNFFFTVFQFASKIFFTLYNAFFLGPVFLLVSFFYFIILKLNQTAILEAKRWTNANSSPVATFLIEMSTAGVIPHIYTGPAPLLAKYQELIAILERAQYTNFVLGKGQSLQYALLSLTAGSLASLVIFLSRSKNITVEETAIYALCLSYVSKIISQIFSFSQNYSTMEQNMNNVERVIKYIDENPRERAGKPDEAQRNPKEQIITQGELEFRDVECQYRENTPKILKGVSFAIQPGEKIGIVGRTGAGKTSLALCISQLLEQSSGEVFFDKKNAMDFSCKSIRKNMNVIPQEPILFKGSLKVNIDPFGEASETHLAEILKKTHLWESLPGESAQEKLEFQVVEGGNNMSVGQRQMITLVRALVHKRKMVLMDEATSNLDDKTEETIQTLLHDEFKESTVVTIAHRLQTVMDYDRVFVMSEGNIVEQGNPKELANDKSSMFGQLVEAMEFGNK